MIYPNHIRIGFIDMKKIFIISILMIASTLACKASCSIDGAAVCGLDTAPRSFAGQPSGYASPAVPFNRDTQFPNVNPWPKANKTNNYDADCQFGICFPKYSPTGADAPSAPFPTPGLDKPISR